MTKKSSSFMEFQERFAVLSGEYASLLSTAETDTVPVYAVAGPEKLEEIKDNLEKLLEEFDGRFANPSEASETQNSVVMLYNAINSALLER